MKCLILAAGYATRLYPLSEKIPKPLLDVAGVSILDRIADKIEKINEIDKIIIATVNPRKKLRGNYVIRKSFL